MSSLMLTKPYQEEKKKGILEKKSCILTSVQNNRPNFLLGFLITIGVQIFKAFWGIWIPNSH